MAVFENQERNHSKIQEFVTSTRLVKTIEL